MTLLQSIHFKYLLVGPSFAAACVEQIVRIYLYKPMECWYFAEISTTHFNTDIPSNGAFMECRTSWA